LRVVYAGCTGREYAMCRPASECEQRGYVTASDAPECEAGPAAFRASSASLGARSAPRQLPSCRTACRSPKTQRGTDGEETRLRFHERQLWTCTREGVVLKSEVSARGSVRLLGYKRKNKRMSGMTSGPCPPPSDSWASLGIENQVISGPRNTETIARIKDVAIVGSLGDRIRKFRTQKLFGKPRPV
jgi:hypothetical protein